MRTYNKSTRQYLIFMLKESCIRIKSYSKCTNKITIEKIAYNTVPYGLLFQVHNIIKCNRLVYYNMILSLNKTIL